MSNEKYYKSHHGFEYVAIINVLLITLLMIRVIYHYYNEQKHIDIHAQTINFRNENACSFEKKQKPNQSKIRVNVKIENLSSRDILNLAIFNLPITSSFIDSMYVIKYTAHQELDGSYIFDSIDLNSIKYFSLYLTGQTPFLEYYLVEPGDSINISIANKHFPDSISKTHPILWNDAYLSSHYKNSKLEYNITGRGSAKIVCKRMYDNIVASDTSRGTIYEPITKKFNVSNHMDVSKNISLSVIDSFKRSMTEVSYNILKADIIGKYNLDWLKDCYFFYSLNGVGKNDTTLIEEIKRKLKNRIRNNQKETITNPYARFYSLYYTNSKVVEERIKSIVFDRANGDSSFDSLKKVYKGKDLDKMLLIYLVNYFQWTDSKTGHMQLLDAYNNVNDVDIRVALERFMDAEQVGKSAFNFSLPDTKGNYITLNSLKGKVVFIDFWYTGCGACADYYKSSLVNVEKEFKNDTSVVFVTISIDQNKEKWVKSVSSGVYTGNEAINLYTDGMGYSHTVIDKYKVRSFPRPIIIDKHGRIFNTSDKELRDPINLTKEIYSAKSE